MDESSKEYAKMNSPPLPNTCFTVKSEVPLKKTNDKLVSGYNGYILFKQILICNQVD